MESVKRYWSSEVFGLGITQDKWIRAADFDRVSAERDALQLLLNERDEQNHSLEQRRKTEQQAGMAAERRVEELGARISETSAKLELAASMMDDDVRGNRFAEVCRLAISALKPTAEAESHVDCGS
jgi:hypothetical protein